MAFSHVLPMASCPCRPSSSLSWRQVCTRAPVKLQTCRRRGRLICLAAANANQPPADTPDPYQVLGVHPLHPFDKVKAAYGRKYKDAERSGDVAAMAALDGAYDKIMMKQLSNRKQGLTTGSFKVSKEIKHADRLALLPWGPKYISQSLALMFLFLRCAATGMAYPPCWRCSVSNVGLICSSCLLCPQVC